MRPYALLFALLWVPIGATAQTEVWTAATVKTSLTKRWDVQASFENRWRTSYFQQFSDLRLTRDARSNWKYFYEFRAPLNHNVRLRHTLGIEKTWKPRVYDVKLVDLNLSMRYHVGRAARVRWGVVAERKIGHWTPELGLETWTEHLIPTSNIRRTRASVAVHWKPMKSWKYTLGWSQQTDLNTSGFTTAQFGAVRMGLRYEL